jgi:hypothetical protein
MIMHTEGYELLMNLGPFGSGMCITHAEMAEVRDYLRQAGADCAQDGGGITEYCYGKYSQEHYYETWTSPTGHELEFKFCGPNPVGPQQNGWSITRASRCPEWTAETAARRARLESAMSACDAEFKE